ncbi:hypothetical protein ACIA98_16245 [Streptomyces sp. NPDC051366]|uniref:hypothetical protein n=1 Tax=Streptomyces sp. NPDC051366 TaxID=3365652 RepID=UPI0037A8254F
MNSLEKAEAQGEVNNYVLLMARQTGCPRQAAIEAYGAWSAAEWKRSPPWKSRYPRSWTASGEVPRHPHWINGLKASIRL